MLIALGASLIATKGLPLVRWEQTYTLAHQLCAHLEDPAPAFPRAAWTMAYYSVRAEYQTAHAFGEQLLALAQQVQDSPMLVAAHRAVGTTLFWLGAVASAHTHFTQGMVLYDLSSTPRRSSMGRTLA